jgi:MFS family permease
MPTEFGDEKESAVKRTFLIIFIFVFASMLGVGIVVPFLSLYAEEMVSDPTKVGMWVGIIVAGFSISRAIFMPIIGRLSDLRGRKIFISIGLLLYVIISFGYVLARNPFELTFVRILQGFSSAMVIPIAMAYVGELSPTEELGARMGGFNMALFLGFAVGPLIGGIFGYLFGMKETFFAMGALCLFAFLLVLLFLPELSIYKRKKKNEISFRKAMESNGVKALVSFRVSNSLGRGIYSAFLPLFVDSYLGLTGREVFLQ